MPLSEEKGFTLCLYCGVIVQALLASREPLRYNELHREASKVFGRRIWIKTFNDHLKRLCEISIVVRKEKNRYHVLYLSDPTVGIRGLMRQMLTQLEIEPAYFKWDLTAKVKNAISKAFTEDHTSTLIIIDEAQLLSTKMLEELRLLTNFRMDSVWPLTLILVGQPTLRQRIRLQSLQALNQRINLRYHLVGLSREETKTYIAHQLKVAGRTDPIFSDDAVELIFAESKGLPRLINTLCTTCLLACCTEEKNIVDQSTVVKAIHEAELP